MKIISYEIVEIITENFILIFITTTSTFYDDWKIPFSKQSKFIWQVLIKSCN